MFTFELVAIVTSLCMFFFISNCTMELQVGLFFYVDVMYRENLGRMPGKPEVEDSDRRYEGEGQILFQSGSYSHQPWWRGLEENASKSSSSVYQISGSGMTLSANEGSGN